MTPSDYSDAIERVGDDVTDGYLDELTAAGAERRVAEWLAQAEYEGIRLRDMAGFCAPWRGDDPETHPNLSWDKVDTALKPLLNHSDCDGDLSPEECAQIAPRLREVVDALWPDENDYDRKNGLALAEGMERAAAAGERLEFC